MSDVEPISYSSLNGGCVITVHQLQCMTGGVAIKIFNISKGKFISFK